MSLKLKTNNESILQIIYDIIQMRLMRLRRECIFQIRFFKKTIFNFFFRIDQNENNPVQDQSCVMKAAEVAQKLENEFESIKSILFIILKFFFSSFLLNYSFLFLFVLSIDVCYKSVLFFLK